MFGGNFYSFKGLIQRNSLLKEIEKSIGCVEERTQQACSFLVFFFAKNRMPIL
jgi:hypothetical protein